jgi:uncharacterized protein YjbI with pentapeptide repeats
VSQASLVARWRTDAGTKLRDAALSWLTAGGVPRPAGLPVHEGRVDLRGLTIPSATHRDTAYAGGMQFTSLDGFLGIRDVHWDGIDFSGSKLQNLRFADSTIRNCLFARADCRDWRLWRCSVDDSSFENSNLRDSALGTYAPGERNQWRHANFDSADLRGVAMVGALISACSFRHAKLNGVHFEQSTVQGCLFEGEVHSCIFDCRELSDRPVASKVRDVDFSRAMFRDVEFRGCTLDGVRFPSSPSVSVVKRFPVVASRVLSVLKGDETLHARVLRADLEVALSHPGSEEASDVLVREDYEAEGADFADFVQTAFERAGTLIWSDRPSK